MISLEEARKIIAESVQPLPPQRVPLDSAACCVLRQQIVATEPVPSADRSMMDGYAVALDDDSTEFTVVMEISAGQVPTGSITRGQCARIFTGAELPAGASQVIPQEEVERTGAKMRPKSRSAKTFVRPRGAEALPGDVLLRAGARLDGAEMAVLAQVGCMQPLVARPLVVLHVATGDELIDPAGTPQPGKIRDTNSSLLRGLLRSREAEMISAPRCGDDLDALVATCRARLDDAQSPPNLLLLSGGASVGDRDYGARVLRELGFEIHFDRVNLRPGKPITFATRGSQPAFVIPGNPVSHFICYYVAIRLAIERQLGVLPLWNFVTLPLGGDMTLHGDPRETFWPARVTVRDNELLVLPRRWSSSGDTLSLPGTNALIRLAPECPSVDPGGKVSVLLLDAPGPE